MSSEREQIHGILNEARTRLHLAYPDGNVTLKGLDKYEAVVMKESSALLQAAKAEARQDGINLALDNTGGEDIKVRAWVAKRRQALTTPKKDKETE